jgi:hypothetical protein
MDEWTKFFRKGHLEIQQLISESKTSQSTETSVVSETWKGNISQFQTYINAKKEVDFEGIWETGAYKFGIKKEGENHIGFIIESGVDNWKPGMIKLRIDKDGEEQKTTFYMRDHSPFECGKPELKGSNFLQLGNEFMLTRLAPSFPVDSVDNYFMAMFAEKPYFEELNANTLYLRIPSFGYESKPAIDKVIAEYKEKILKTENFIIDLRYNGGGSDQSFSELLPFLYTNPIRSISVEFLSTPLNNQRFLDISNNPDFDEDMQQWAKNVYDKLQEKLGEFVFPFNVPISTDLQDTIYEYPKNVGIIINEGNASTTEQFLLAAKQSKKVKLFGVTTSGALDISNMTSVESPCKEFALYYCLSRSLRIPDMTIDDIGLQPDYYLDKTIPQHKWVEFVNDILNGK